MFVFVIVLFTQVSPNFLMNHKWCAFTCMLTCSCGSHRWMLYLLLKIYLPFSLRQGFRWTWRELIKPYWLTSKLQGLPISPLRGLGLQMYTDASAFYWNAVDQFRSSGLHDRHFQTEVVPSAFVQGFASTNLWSCLVQVVSQFMLVHVISKGVILYCSWAILYCFSVPLSLPSRIRLLSK